METSTSGALFFGVSRLVEQQITSLGRFLVTSNVARESIEVFDCRSINFVNYKKENIDSKSPLLEIKAELT